MSILRALRCWWSCHRVQPNPYGGWDYVGCRHRPPGPFIDDGCGP